ncbi:AbrB/MazE/SpoVT family DNA-binding domain-containing protein [Sciscionella marina]|uniref:AbrB/MazE/SpoVT family DNA-binding domain-containing protein n=1 Tax=Sciscionella marina TaxID=508770 RepID=UPI0003814A5D
MRITEKGQLTIPIDVRKALGIRPGDEVEVRLEGDHAVLQRIERPADYSRLVIEQLRGKGDVPMTTDQIMALMRGDG